MTRCHLDSGKAVDPSLKSLFKPSNHAEGGDYRTALCDVCQPALQQLANVLVHETHQRHLQLLQHWRTQIHLIMADSWCVVRTSRMKMDESVNRS